jgi:spermine oxidase
MFLLFVSMIQVDIVQTPKPHNVVATTEDGRRLPFSILQEIYEAYFW